MQYLSNKLIIRYLLFLALIFALCIGLIEALHFYGQTLKEEIQKEERIINSHVEQTHTLIIDLLSLHSLFYSITAAAPSSPQRKNIEVKINAYLENVDHSLKNLNNSPLLYLFEAKKRLVNEIPSHLKDLNQQLKKIMELTTLRDTLLARSDENLASTSFQIRSTNANIPSLFEEMLILTKNLEDELVAKREILFAKNKKLEKHQKYTEWTAIFGFSSVFIIILILSFRQLVQMFHQLENRLKIDPLTSLPNRFAFAIESKACKTSLVAIVNIDDFRIINELYGTAVGNEVLVKLAQYLNLFAKKHELQLFRSSGDEFVFLHCQNGLKIEDLIEYINSLILSLKAHSFNISTVSVPVKISLSCGISSHSENPLGKADIALRHAKLNRKYLAVFNEKMDSKKDLEKHRYWLNKIEWGLENNAFIPVYQPIVNKEGVAVHYEALMRLAEKNSKGIIQLHPPVNFLTLSQKSKSYPELSLMTLLKAIKFAKEANVPISVNLSYQDIVNRSVQEALYEAISLQEVGSLITFEITETEDIKNYSDIASFMKKFRLLGVKLAIDDFGSGFSNFNYISKLGPDIIKIDGSLIKDLDSSIYAQALVQAICTLSGKLKITTVAEFVHSEAVFKKAKSLGVDSFQGYYFSPPLLCTKAKNFSYLPK